MKLKVTALYSIKTRRINKLKRLNTYLIILLAIVVIIIFAVNLGNNGLGTQAKHFDNGEISFDYPGALTKLMERDPILRHFQIILD